MTKHKSEPKERRIHRLMDEVYREMFRLEAGYPGAEMGLALALLRSWVAADVRAEDCKDWAWLSAISPLGLKMIQDSLNRGCTVTETPEKACRCKAQS
jgi:hypothetical protein